MDDLFHFIDNYLIPALHQGGMANAFPNITFVKRGNKWGAKNYLNGQKHRDRWDKIWTTTDSSANCKPHLIKEQGGDSISIIKFYQTLTGVSFIEAVKALSAACGLPIPEREDSETYRAFREKQEKLEQIASKMSKALSSDEGESVLSYLRNGRGYSDEFIEFAEFGYCSPETASELRSVLHDGVDEPTYFSKNIGTTNVLSIPYRTAGRIQGFVFRRIDGEKSGKYCDVFISQKAKKSFHFFGLSGLPLTGNADKDRDLTIVEGEIDALHALHSGVKNVVAASGGEVSDEALKEAKRKGVLRVTLLFDSEDSDTKQEETYKKIEKAIQAIRRVGLEPFVSSFGVWTIGNDRVKMDSDTYLQNHSGDELQHLIRSTAENGSLWEYGRILRKFQLIEEADGEERIFETDFSEFRREVIQLCKRIPSRADRERIYSEFSRVTQGVLSEEVMREEAEEELQEQKRLQSIAEAKKIAQEVISLTEQGKMDEAIALGKKLTDLSEVNKENEYAPLLATGSISRIRENYLNKPKGIHTGYFFGENGENQQQELIIQAAALTYICAPTSHGKTTFLQNLALRTAQSDDRDGDVIFISFEESEDDITTEFLTLYIGEHLSANLLRSIRSYYSGDGIFFRDGASGASFAKFQQKEAEFDRLLTSGKLRIYRRRNQISDLSGLITYLNKTLKVKAIFVDYVQRIKNKEIRGTKKDVIEAVCDELMNVSLATGLPIVLGAQLNRQAYSPLEMENQNVADASDIEHSANTIVLLWNSDTKPQASSTKYFTDNKREKFTPEAQAIESKGFNIGTAGKLYALLSKNRGGKRNLSAVFNFNGNTRAITQHYPSIPEKKPEVKIQDPQNSLPFAPPSGDMCNDF